VATYGDVDELNSVLGWALTSLTTPTIRERLSLVQHDLFRVGAHLASNPAEGRPQPGLPEFPRTRVEEMEGWMDEAGEELPPLRAFILPGGSAGAAAMHMARSVCRRAERSAVDLLAQENVDPDVVRYLNRLSDLLFVFARLENARSGWPDVMWRKDHDGPGSETRES
jgi:cob(I)alamin adenosyltransferase